MMKIGMACDHGAYSYKEEIKQMLMDEGHEVVDCGCHDTSGFSLENCSAATSTNGFNALEPAAVIVPLKLFPFESLSFDAAFELHPTIAADNPTIIAPFKNLFIFSLSSFLSTHIS